MRKPNKLTLAPKAYTQSLMDSIPFSRVQGFGGKLGAQLLHEFGDDITGGTAANTGGNSNSSSGGGGGVKTVGDILKIDKALLTSKFGSSTALWMRNAAAGMCGEPVLDRALALSIGCSKTFRGQHALPLLLPLQTTGELEQLCTEIEALEKSQQQLLLHNHNNNNNNNNNDNSKNSRNSINKPAIASPSSSGSSPAPLVLNTRTDGSPVKVGAIASELDAKYRSNVLYWLRALALELQERVEADVAANSRIPQLLTVGATLRRVAYNNNNSSSSSSSNNSNGGQLGRGHLHSVAEAIDVNPLPPPPRGGSSMAPNIFSRLVPAAATSGTSSGGVSNATAAEEIVLIPDFHISRSGTFKLHSVSLRLIVKHALVLLCKVLSDNPHVGPYCSGLAGEGGTADGWVVGILSLSAGQFKDVVSGAGSIASFFAKESTSASYTTSASVSASTAICSTICSNSTRGGSAGSNCGGVVNSSLLPSEGRSPVPAAVPTAAVKGLYLYFGSKQPLSPTTVAVAAAATSGASPFRPTGTSSAATTNANTNANTNATIATVTMHNNSKYSSGKATDTKDTADYNNYNQPSIQNEVCLIHIDDDNKNAAETGSRVGAAGAGGICGNDNSVGGMTTAECECDSNKRKRESLLSADKNDLSSQSSRLNRTTCFKEDDDDEKSIRSCKSNENISYRERQKRSFSHIQPASCGEIDPSLLAELPADLLQELLDEHHGNYSAATTSMPGSIVAVATTTVRTTGAAVNSSSRGAAGKGRQQQQQQSKTDIRSFLLGRKKT